MQSIFAKNKTNRKKHKIVKMMADRVFSAVNLVFTTINLGLVCFGLGC